jgi:galactoside O-acetyltransferase
VNPAPALVSTIPPELRPGECLPEAELHRQLAFCGRGVKVYRGCRIVGAERVRIGDHTQVDEGVFLFAGEGVEIGRYVHLAFLCSISGGGRCQLEDFCGIGAGVRIVTGSDDISGTGLTNPTVPPSMRSVRRSHVIIRRHALIFTNAVVLPGVTIGEGAVVAAGSVVHHDLRPWAVYAGNPLTQVAVRAREEIENLAARFTPGLDDQTRSD